jgi:prepilin-type N-terminal cleavage/methylation domain-containing protein
MSVRKNQGFTLIEIAIVLVIIGLLLGGVLKGQELINSARVKSFATDFRNIPVYIYGFQDRFRALPGDDPAVETHLPGNPPAVPAATLAVAIPGSAVGDGVINGAWNSVTGTDESCLFWQHVRMANLAPGPTAVNCAAGNTYYPRNANGGQIGIQSNNAAFVTITGGMTGSYIICSAAILGSFVLQLDSTMDDGDPATGSMRAVLSSAPGAPSSIAFVNGNPGEAFTVCMGV